MEPLRAAIGRHDGVRIEAGCVFDALPKRIGAKPRANAGEGRAEVAGGALSPGNRVAEEAAAIDPRQGEIFTLVRVSGENERWEETGEREEPLHPRPTNGMLVA